MATREDSETCRDLLVEELREGNRTYLIRGLLGTEPATIKQERDSRHIHRLAVAVGIHQLLQLGRSLDAKEHLIAILHTRGQTGETRHQQSKHIIKYTMRSKRRHHPTATTEINNHRQEISRNLKSYLHKSVHPFSLVTECSLFLP